MNNSWLSKKRRYCYLHMQYSLMFRDTVLRKWSVSYSKEHLTYSNFTIIVKRCSWLLWPIWGVERKNNTQRAWRHPYLHDQSSLADVNSNFFYHRQKKVRGKGSCVKAVMESDNGTNIVGAERERREVLKTLVPRRIHQGLMKYCCRYWGDVIRMLM